MHQIRVEADEQAAWGGVSGGLAAPSTAEALRRGRTGDRDPGKFPWGLSLPSEKAENDGQESCSSWAVLLGPPHRQAAGSPNSQLAWKQVHQTESASPGSCPRFGCRSSSLPAGLQAGLCTSFSTRSKVTAHLMPGTRDPPHSQTESGAQGVRGRAETATLTTPQPPSHTV